jgi:hypothetical protein
MRAWGEARIRHASESTRKIGVPVTRTAADVEPPEGALASLVDQPYKTKNKSKANRSTGTDTSKLPHQDNTHSSEAVRIFTALYHYVSRGFHVYLCVTGYNAVYSSGQNRMHTSCTVCAFANRQLCCTFIVTAPWSISNGMGVHTELSQWMITTKANTLKRCTVCRLCLKHLGEYVTPLADKLKEERSYGLFAEITVPL